MDKLTPKQQKTLERAIEVMVKLLKGYDMNEVKVIRYLKQVRAWDDVNSPIILNAAKKVLNV